MARTVGFWRALQGSRGLPTSSQVLPDAGSHRGHLTDTGLSFLLDATASMAGLRHNVRHKSWQSMLGGDLMRADRSFMIPTTSLASFSVCVCSQPGAPLPFFSHGAGIASQRSSPPCVCALGRLTVPIRTGSTLLHVGPRARAI